MHTDPYTIMEHAAGRRPLRRQDRSRYSTVRLTITRSSAAYGTVSVIVRSVGAGVASDTRLAVARIDLSPGTTASESPMRALEVALATLLAKAPIDN